MSAALFIVVESAVPGFDVSVNGKALSKVEPMLKKIACDLSVKPLMEFYGADDSEIAKENGVAEPERFRAKWFEARDGLVSIRSLLKYVKLEPNSVEASQEVISDLMDFERVLAEAESRELKWHLEVDY